MFAEEIHYHHRTISGADIYFLVNNSLEEIDGDFLFRAKGKAELWDPSTGEISEVNAENEGSGSELKLTFPPRAGLFVVFE